jgi:hypothetical protein
LPFIITVTLAFVDIDAPDHPENVYPLAAVAVTVTDAPSLCVVEPVDVTPLTVTVPPAVGFLLTVSVYVGSVIGGSSWKIADIVILLFTVTVMGFSVPDKSPVHSTNSYPLFGVAVSVTDVPAPISMMPVPQSLLIVPPLD